MDGGKPRSGGPDWTRILWLALSIVLVFAVGTGATYGVLAYLELRDLGQAVIKPGIAFEPSEGVTALPEADVVTEVVNERTNILLVGSDSRDGLSEEQLAAIGTEETGTDLTDTIILLQLDPATDAAAMLSFPRDLLVTRCDGSRGRINEAFYIGDQQEEGLGPACLVQTIENLTRIEIDHYARINFAGFVGIVDALGGVTFYIDEPLQDRFAGLDIPAGCVDFDGITAIQFVRARRLDSGGDFGRIARQQRFAREMIRKATSVGTLLQPQRVAAVITGISDTLETDSDFGISEMIDLVNSVSNISAGTVDARTVPARPRMFGEAAVVEAIEGPADELFTAFARGDLLPDGIGTEAAPEELSPSNVIPVDVQNGGDADGNGEAAAAALEALGFTVGDVGTLDNYGFDNSQILHPPERADHAEILAAALGGIRTFESSTLDADRLVLQLGNAFDPAQYAPQPDPTATVAESEDPAVEPSADGDLSQEEFRGAELSDIEC